MTNSTRLKAGRWLKEKDKLTYVNSLFLNIAGICLGFKGDKITNPFDLSIDLERVNPSPLLVDMFLSPGIDFSDFQLQESMTIRCKNTVEMNFRQPTYTYLLRCMDLNVNFQD